MTAYAVLDALAGLVDPPVAMAAAIYADDKVDEAYDVAQEKSRFEFGSIGKTMTAQVLATLVLDGAVDLDDPISEWFNAGANGDITLGQLAAHKSGLPRMPANWDQGDLFDPADPYASYSADLAEAALRSAPRVPAEQSEYSNFGYTLLGLALVRMTEVPLGDLFREYVFDPFELKTATTGPGPNQVQGYSEGEETPAWNMLLAGPGGVCGTLADLVKWGVAAIDPMPALDFAIENELGWSRTSTGLLWHNGGTYGGHACLVVDQQAKRVAATVVATGDLGHVDDATFIACTGGDPFTARPEPISDEQFDDDAIALIGDLAASQWDAARKRMTDSCAATLSVDVLSGAWSEVTGARGAFLSSSVSGRSLKSGAFMVTLDISFANDRGKAEVYFNDDGDVVGLRIA